MAEPDTSPTALARLRERLEAETTPEQFERYLKFWDLWRANIIGGDLSDGPRLGFESVMEAKDDLIAEASAAILALESERAEIVKHLDEGAVACKGGTVDWSLPDRVLIAVRASNDTGDYEPATIAEARLLEIAEIAESAPRNPQPVLSKLRRIAAIARSKPAEGEG